MTQVGTGGLHALLHNDRSIGNHMRSRPYGSRSRAWQRVAVPTVAALAAIGLAGCAAGTTDATPAATDGASLFSQELHDLLPASIQDSGVVSFGALWETPPLISVDVNDPTVPIGITPDLSALIGEVLGVDVEWQNLQWPAQLPGVQAGNVDALFGQVTITEERELSIVDLVAWNQSTESILVAAGNPESIESLADLCGLVAAVPIGSTQGEYVAAASEDCVAAGKAAIDVQEYQGATAAIQALRAGTVDAWLNSTADQEAAVAADPSAFEAVLIPESEVATTYGGIAVAKDQPGLSEALAGALKLLIEDGSYQGVLEEWGASANALTVDQVLINPITGTPAGEIAG